MQRSCKHQRHLRKHCVNVWNYLHEHVHVHSSVKVTNRLLESQGHRLNESVNDIKAAYILDKQHKKEYL